MTIKDNKIEIIEVRQYPTQGTSVRAKLIAPYLVNEQMHFIMPQSELIPERLWNITINNKQFMWFDTEGKYKYVNIV